MIGLHPSTTRLFLADGRPAFQGVGSPKPLLETPSGGKNIVTGIGLYTNGINPRAVGALWRSGSQSLMNDVRFLGGHGTIDPDASAEESKKVWSQIYNNTHTADSNLNRRWDGQYPSLWVTEGGGGTFVNIWTPSTFAQAGLYVSHTSTPGRIYQLSSEHHVRNEAVFDDVSNWQVFALQTEEERGEGGFAVPLEILDSKNLLIANMHIYRVVSAYQPAPYALVPAPRTSACVTFTAIATVRPPSTMPYMTKHPGPICGNANLRGLIFLENLRSRRQNQIQRSWTIRSV